MRTISAVLFIFSSLMSNLKATPPDSHSCSLPQQVVVQKVHLDLKVDFNQNILKGSAILDLQRADTMAPLWLDTRNLKILKIIDPQSGEICKYTLHPENQWLGSPLEIELKAGLTQVRIEYEASPEAAALQWLSPEQTLGKQHPFLFSQSQAILARSWMPIQDSPGVRFRFDATVQVPPGMMALMSAENPQKKSPDGKYSFKMNQPIPAYLMSLAVGDFEYKKIGRNTGVYAEPRALEAAAWEFSEMQDMLDAAENLYGAYQWEQYDVLLLPPSFPFGGMENPRITYATPTILAGDRSLVSLIAHELAHSWSGNLVTNATWNDFWLNEGFTVYFERRIMEALKGKPYADMLELLGWQDVHHTIEDFGKDSPSTCLKLKLDGKDPDDGMNDIAYEKGYFFLRTIENLVGREAFDAFLKRHFTANAFQSLNTETFLQQLYQYLLISEEDRNAIQVEKWVYQPGMPDNAPQPKAELFDKVSEQLTQDLPDAGIAKAWSTHEWLHYLRHLPEDISLARMEKMDNQFGFTQSGNSEILAEWFMLAFKRNYQPAYEAAERFIIQTGRRKFIVPLYKELAKTPKGKMLARSIYAKARPNYHFVARATLDDLLGA